MSLPIPVANDVVDIQRGSKDDVLVLRFKAADTDMNNTDNLELFEAALRQSMAPWHEVFDKPFFSLIIDCTNAKVSDRLIQCLTRLGDKAKNFSHFPGNGFAVAAIGLDETKASDHQAVHLRYAKEAGVIFTLTLEEALPQCAAVQQRVQASRRQSAARSA